MHDCWLVDALTCRMMCLAYGGGIGSFLTDLWWFDLLGL